ncbi:MAG: hypothetical protein ACRDPY_06700 [Streptosporangiaceae bacterium]
MLADDADRDDDTLKNLVARAIGRDLRNRPDGASLIRPDGYVAWRTSLGQSRWRVLPNMISSQDGTDDRLPRAAFLPCRPAWSPTGSVCVG